MKYVMNRVDASRVRKISMDYGLDMLSATILSRRGMDDKESLKFVFESDLVYQYSPFLFDDMETAVERINDAIAEGEKIFIFGDRDVDGITSTAIMYKELTRLGAKDIVCRLPLNDEPYGLSADIVSEIVDSGATLLITVDNGISAIEEVRTLRDEGIDTIIVDHHISGETFPPSLALIDPKIPGSGYPFDGLAGCMVAFKLCYALRFARTPLYQSECIFFHARPGKDTVRMSAVKMVNFIVEDECSEELSIGMVPSSESRMIRFLDQNLPIIVMDREQESLLISKAFSDSPEVMLNDVRREIEAVISSVRGKSLFTLSQISRAIRYTDMEDEELATLISLFRSAMLYKNRSLNEGLDEIIALAAIGTVADLMPMRSENRLFVRRGLKILEKNAPDYLKLILSHFDLIGKSLTSRDISFYIAPLINSSGRLGRPDIALSLLFAKERCEIESLTDKLISMNKERKANTESALSNVRSEAESSLSFFLGRFVLVEKDVPRGLTGAIASRLLSETGKPTLVLAAMEDGRISASMRTRKNFNARAFLDNFSSLFQDFGGHSCAAGFSMAKENLERFKAALTDAVFSLSEDEEEEEEIVVDAELPESYMSSEIWKTKDLFEPYGQENEALRFHIRRALVSDVLPNRNGGTFLRFSISYNGEIWPAVFWDYDDEKGAVHKGDAVELVFSPEVNTYRGISRLQLNISALEIIG